MIKHLRKGKSMETGLKYVLAGFYGFYNRASQKIVHSVLSTPRHDDNLQQQNSTTNFWTILEKNFTLFCNFPLKMHIDTVQVKRMGRCISFCTSLRGNTDFHCSPSTVKTMSFPIFYPINTYVGPGRDLTFYLIFCHQFYLKLAKLLWSQTELYS